MSQWLRVSRRAAFAVLSVYLVVSVAFLFIALAPDPNLQSRLAQAEQNGASDAELQEIRQEYLEAQGRTGTLAERYVGWMVDVTTLDWGRSRTQNAPVTTVLVQAGGRTLAYVLPAMLLAAILGIAVGAYAGTRRGGLVDRLGTGTAYVGLGLPDFFIASMLLFVLFVGPDGDILYNDGLLQRVVIPAFAIGTTLFAGQLRHARAEAAEYGGAEFVKLLRAKGAGTRRVVRHLVRNAAVPMVSLFVTDLLAVLVLSVYVVESAMGIPGIGFVSFVAITQRDVPLVLGTTMVVVFVGILGNLLQDVASTVLDPRVGE